MNKPLNRLLHEGDRFEMFIEGMRVSLESSLDEVLNQNELKLQTQLPSIPMKALSQKTVELVTKKDATGIIRIKGKIKSLDYDGAFAEMTIELDDDIEQMQRRAFYRLPILRDITVLSDQATKVVGMTQNISAGGLKCLISSTFSVGELIHLSMDLGKDTYQFKARILQSSPVDQSDSKCMVRVEFLNISEKQRSKLLAYIFQEQSKQQLKRNA